MTSNIPNISAMVFVEWIDSVNGEATWISRETMENYVPSVVQSVGWLVDDKPNHVTISQHWCTTEGVLPFGQVTVIPKAAIITIDSLTR